MVGLLQEPRDDCHCRAEHIPITANRSHCNVRTYFTLLDAFFLSVRSLNGFLIDSLCFLCCWALLTAPDTLGSARAAASTPTITRNR